jgi:RND superfamily putative drug exporter
VAAPPGARPQQASGGPQLSLTVVAGRAVGQTIAVSAEPAVFGRGQTGAAALGGDPELSREHARVSAFESGGVLLEDLGSTNGTFVNGGRVAAPTLLRDGDVVWMGTTTLLVRAPGEPLPGVTPVEPPTPSAQAGFLSRIGALAVHKPKLILGLLGVFLVASFALGGPVTGILRDNRGFDDPNSENSVIEPIIGEAGGVWPGARTVALYRAQGGKTVDDPSVRREVQSLAQKLRRGRDVKRVLTFYDTRDPFFVSRDRKSTALAVFYGVLTQAQREDRAKELKDALADPPKIEFGGQAIVNSELREQVKKDLSKAELIGFPLLLIASLFVFRGVVAALIPILVGVITVFGTFMILRLINAVGNVNVFAINIVTALGLGLAIDYSLFLVSRYREELVRVGRGRPQNQAYGATDTPAKLTFGAEDFAGTQGEALRRTVLTAGRTIMFSSATVAVAMASLLVFPQPFLYSMGIGGAVTAIVAVLVALVAVPALLSVLGPRINALSPKAFQRAAYRTAAQERSGAWYKLAHTVMRVPGYVAVLAAALMLAVAFALTRVDFVGVNARMLPEALTAKKVSDSLQGGFPADPASQIQLLIDAPRSAKSDVDAFVTRLGAFPDVAKIYPPRSLNERYWQIDVQPWGDGMDPRTIQLVKDIRKMDAPFRVRATGESAAFVDEKSSLTSKLPISLAILAVSTLLILYLMTGSVILPIKSVILNMLTLGFTLGLLVLIFQDGRVESLLDFKSLGALDMAQPILICALAFGLSTDYAVFLLGRIHEARVHGESDREAVALGIERTGRLVTQAAILFCLAIGAFATSSVIFIKQDGVGTAAAVLIDATIVRALLVPALMAMLGSRNWWAPGPLRRLHERIGFSEA